MLPLSDWPVQHRAKLVGVFTDIDDTLTTQGAITPDALQALADLKAAGLIVIAITGRPIGWCAPFALGDTAQGITPWPVDAMVAENGALAFAPALTADSVLEFTRKNGGSRNGHGHIALSKLYQQEASTRAANYAHMQQVVRALFGRDLRAELDHWAFVGDSTNDQLMFEHFPHSVGVANVRRFAPQLTHLPRYIAPSERGAGFAQVAQALLEARQ